MTTASGLPEKSAKKRSWGTYAFISSIALVVNSVLAFFSLIMMAMSSFFTVIASGLFYLSIGFSISTFFFFIMSMITGKERRLGLISLAGPVFLIACILIVRNILSAGFVE